PPTVLSPNPAPPTRLHTLSLHDALPISRAGLLVALAYRPELLVLDEPSSGLDPIVRKDILGAVIRTIAAEGRTVLFSSHLLEEVDRKSTRLNSSHRTISYAVFCLKKKRE